MFKPSLSASIITLLIIGSVLTSTPDLQAGGLSLEQAESTVDSFNEQERPVRRNTKLLPMSYVEVDGKPYGYQLPMRFIRLARLDYKYEIKKIKKKDNMLQIEIKSNHGIKHKIILFDIKSKVTRTLLENVFPLVLSEIFEYGTSRQLSKLTANTQSGLAHLSICNHLPPDSLREGHPHISGAVEAGFRLCPACFPPDPPLPYPNYMPIRIAALEQARLHERAFPLVPDQALQDSLQTLGEALVSKMPFSQKHFPYQFRAVQSEVMQALSFPTGFIYVTDKLLDAIESELELAHVLAHEIAHSELHLPPNHQIQEPVFGTRNSWKKYFQHSRWRETEADMIAQITLARTYRGNNVRSAGISILRKLQFANEATSVLENNEYDTHPSFGQRLAWFENPFFPVLTHQVFEALDKNGDWIFRMKVLGGGYGKIKPSGDKKRKRGPVVHLLVEVPDWVEKGLTIPPNDDWLGGMHTEGGTEFSLQSSSGYYFPPGSMGILSLRVDRIQMKDYGVSQVGKPKFLDPSNLKLIKLKDVPDSDKWVRSTDI